MVQFSVLSLNMALVLLKNHPVFPSSLTKFPIWLDWQCWPARAATTSSFFLGYFWAKPVPYSDSVPKTVPRANCTDIKSPYMALNEWLPFTYSEKRASMHWLIDALLVLPNNWTIQVPTQYKWNLILVFLAKAYFQVYWSMHKEKEVRIQRSSNTLNYVIRTLSMFQHS